MARKRLSQLWLLQFTLVFLASMFFGWFNPTQVDAAEVTIDGAAHDNGGNHMGQVPTTVFTSDTTGYTFYRRDSDGACAWSKTTNSGTSWGASTGVIDSQTDCVGVGVWYDQWTPGDTTGTNIHVITVDTGSDDLWYTRFNTSGDTATTTVSVSSSPGPSMTNTIGGDNAADRAIIAKGTDGDLYTGIMDGDASTTSYVLKCTSSCDTASNWSDTSASFGTVTNADQLILMPLSSGNMLGVRYNRTDQDVESDVYTDGAPGSWSGTWTDVNTSGGINNANYDSNISATVNRSSGAIYLAYLTGMNSVDGDEYIRTAVYSGGTWTNKTDVISDSGSAGGDAVCAGTNDCGLTGAKISIDDSSGDLYVAYSARTTKGTASTANVYYRRSTDGMTSWSLESVKLNGSSGDFYGTRVNLLSDQRLYATWVVEAGGADNDLMGNTVADLPAPSYDQAAYRWFDNADSLDLDSASTLATVNSAATLSANWGVARLRILLHVSNTEAPSSELFKLQYAVKSGSCGTYADVTSQSAIAYKDNPTPADGSAMNEDPTDDPTHSGHTVVAQNYEESNTLAMQAAIPSGQDGKWDISLRDNDGNQASVTYCFRIVKSDGSALNTYTVTPELTTHLDCNAPTQHDLMRGGNYTCSGSEQKFNWAN